MQLKSKVLRHYCALLL